MSMLRVFAPKFRSRVSKPVAAPQLMGNVGGADSPIRLTETVHLSGCSTRLKVTCKSGQMHAHWACDCGASGIATPYLSIESARDAAFAAVGRHHTDRHANPTCGKASA